MSDINDACQEVNGDAGGCEFLWGARAIAEAADCSEQKIEYLLWRGQLKCARKIGGRWVCSRAALIAELGGGAQ